MCCSVVHGPKPVSSTDQIDAERPCRERFRPADHLVHELRRRRRDTQQPQAAGVRHRRHQLGESDEAHPGRNEWKFESVFPFK
jgi:hypothetical protein